MSIWTNVDGIITTKKDEYASMSIKRAIKITSMRAHELKIYRISETDDMYTSKLDWRFDSTGLDAAIIIEDFISNLKAYDSTSCVILNVNIRWEV